MFFPLILGLSMVTSVFETVDEFWFARERMVAEERKIDLDELRWETDGGSCLLEQGNFD